MAQKHTLLKQKRSPKMGSFSRKSRFEDRALAYLFLGVYELSMLARKPTFLMTLLVLVACGGEAAQMPTEQESGISQGAESLFPEPEQIIEGSDAREIGAEQTFADLVALIKALDSAGQTHSDAGCLLDVKEQPWQFRADVAVAHRPVPESVDDIDPLLATIEAVQIHTRWGVLGRAARGPKVVALTTSPMDLHEQALAVFLTDEGVYARTTSLAINPPFADKLAIGDLPHALARVKDAYDGVFDGAYVVAEDDIALGQIHRVLKAISTLDLATAFAVVLPASATLGKPGLAKQRSKEGLCSGLPAIAPGAPFAELSATQLQNIQKALDKAGHRCLEHSCGTGVTGGVVKVAIQFNPHGEISQSCIMDDETGDVSLRECLLSAAKSIELPVLEGYVNLQLPLRLVHLPTEQQRPLCD
ncbi:MAG: hypothetical protein IPJ88_00585 [Myxococcales bacterium]|nr:MAG: hypothetical protein IPJ88_00585 [Myxococcales bacterium]